jgi:hypothetical protein
MFIKNINSGVTMECLNKDVIRQCTKDDGYIVAETLEGLGAYSPEAREEPKRDETNEDGEITDNDEKKESETTGEAAEGDYSSMKINDLRKIAKEKGIQGYTNMDKLTLAEVIKALG